MGNMREGGTLTITLTSRPPVTITRVDWSIIASASGNVQHGDERSRYDLFVRRHQDGRSIVYGLRIRDGRKIRSGLFLASDAGLLAGIARVALDVTGIEADAQELARVCIARLPAERLS